MSQALSPESDMYEFAGARAVRQFEAISSFSDNRKVSNNEADISRTASIPTSVLAFDERAAASFVATIAESIAFPAINSRELFAESCENVGTHLRHRRSPDLSS